MKHRVGIVGLGQMGRAMLERLRDAGFEASGYDAIPSLSETSSVPELCERSDVIILSLPDGPAVEKATSAIARAGLTVIDCSTDTPETARKVSATLASRDVDFLDAPVSGGREGARGGALTVLVGGPREVLDTARPVLDAISSKIVHVGDVGSGQVAKLANNLLVATTLAAMSEVVELARQAGVAPESLIEAVNVCSGRSAVSEVNYPRWILNGRFDSGFSAALMRKDVRLATELAERLGFQMEIGELIAALWNDRDISGDADFNRIAEIKDGLER